MPQSVWIAQVQCPQHHTVVAAAGEARDHEDAVELAVNPLREMTAKLLAEGHISPWCNICGEPAEMWSIKLGRTEFTTMREAEPAMRAIEQQNLLAHQVLGGHPGPGKVN